MECCTKPISSANTARSFKYGVQLCNWWVYGPDAAECRFAEGVPWAADATVPSIYNKAFTAVDPDGSGETSVNALSRVLGTSSLPAATIDKVRFIQFPQSRE